MLATEDMYGGTCRLFDKIYSETGIRFIYTDTSQLKNVKEAFSKEKIRALFLESPTNPVLKCADIKAISEIAKYSGAITIVDNTFLTPLLQKPLEMGAHITVYSATKYLSGHNDVLAGIVVTNDEKLAERIYFYQNAVGAVLSPFDSWLVIRGLKTLSLRLQKQQENARIIADFLRKHRRVKRVYYPEIGAIISFEIDDEKAVSEILKKVKVFLFAESLGGVESLITYPYIQTHADIPQEIRERLGINKRLLRLSIGIEDADDLIADLDRCLG